MTPRKIKNTIKSVLSILVIAIISIALVISGSLGGGRTERMDNQIAKIGKYKLANNNFMFREMINRYAQYYGQNPNDMPDYFISAIVDATVETYYNLILLEQSNMAISQNQISNTLMNIFRGGIDRRLTAIELDRINQIIEKDKNSYYEYARVLIAMDTMINYSRSLTDFDLDSDKLFLETISKDAVSLDVVKLTDNIIEKDAIYDYFEGQKDLFAEVDLSVLSLSNKDNSVALKEDLAQEPELFEEKVKEFSIDSFSSNEGKIEANRFFEILKTLNIKNDNATKEILSLEAGEIFGPIKTSLGYSILKANSNSREANLDNTNDIYAVKDYLQANNPSLYDDAFKASADAYFEKAKEDFEASALAKDYHITKVQNLPIAYANVFSQFSDAKNEMEIPSTNEEFLHRMFEAEDVFGPVLDGNRYLVGKITDRTENILDIDMDSYKSMFYSLYSQASKTFRK